MTKNWLILTMFLIALAQSQPNAPAAPQFTKNPVAGASDGSTSSRNGRIESLTLHDGARNKDLEFRITYPASGASAQLFPVVIFSHGALGSKDNYDYLIEYWARHGYVCVQPTHADSLILLPKMQRMRAMREIARSLPSDADAWDNRAKDISFAVDSLPSMQKQIPVRLDYSKIACAGHSLGAFTTGLVSGLEPPPPAQRKDYRDNRIVADMMFSPQGIRTDPSDFGFADATAWKHLAVPTLFLTGTLDDTQFTKYKNRIIAFDSSPPGGKYFAVIQGAGHMTFSGGGNASLVGASDERPASAFQQRFSDKISEVMTPERGDHQIMLDDICRITTAFLDCYLKGQTGARAILTRPGSFGNLVTVSAK